jgi:two-component system, NarL family, nitrate/nitrite response regulator NarL
VSKIIPTIVVASSVLLREGITSFLQGTPYKVIAAVAKPTELADDQFRNGANALAIVEIECGMQDQAAKIIALLRSLMPNGKIVLATETSRPADLQSILSLAPDGYILNPASRDLLLKSLELIVANQQIVVLGPPTAALSDGGHDIRFPGAGVGPESGSHYEFGKRMNQLSCRERQVLICIAHGEPNKQIAQVCGISEAAVKAHLKAILRKTNAQNRTQAAIWAIDHRLATADVAA